jgi:threonine/homoserine/homoserine lactone efflux protein
MSVETILTFSVLACFSILSPGPAVLLALRNGVAFGMRAVVWSSLGNVTGLFLLSVGAMLGLGALLKSSVLLFASVKVLGALYLFYIGARHLFGRSPVLGGSVEPSISKARPSPLALFREALLLAATNPKPILFFTALFPQFLNAQAPLFPQFLVLTGIFMALSFVTLVSYARAASQARVLLLKPHFAKWINRLVGAVFVAFGAALLALRRPAT